MRVLAIETSCDETAVAIVEAEGNFPDTSFTTLGTALYSQAELHNKYGGVFPSLAKREHGGNLAPLTKVALTESNLWEKGGEKLTAQMRQKIEEMLSREGELIFGTLEILETAKKPALDAIVVTQGPGLEPALWVGVNFARALSLAWDLPLIPVNHLEGHLLISLVRENKVKNVPLPLLGLLISGGHTEFVLMEKWGSYKKIGETRDDAVGEAFDKTARMLGLSYPGGPQVARLAEEARIKNITAKKRLPRPMEKSGDLDFSFSGLKTAVLYMLRDIGEPTDEDKLGIAREFEDAAAETLIIKTRDALKETGAQGLVLGGGVAANLHLRSQMKNLVAQEFSSLELYLPDPTITVDNAVMIAVAGIFKGTSHAVAPDTLSANANLSF